MSKLIDELTVKDLREIRQFFGNQKITKESSHPFKIGKAYFIRTVTMIVVGKLEEVHESELVLSDASWIADSGRFSDALKGGEKKLNEVEPFFDDVIVGRSAIIDATIWAHDLPKIQK